MSKRLVNSLAVGAAVVALALAGCSKDKKEKGAGGEAAASASSAFAMFPATSVAVIGMNFERLRGSELYKMVEPMLKGQMSSEMAEFEAKCGFDPYAATKSLQMAIVTPEPPKMMAAVDGMPKDKFDGCVDAMVATAKEKGEQVEMTRDGDITSFKGDGEEVHMTWNGPQMVVAVGMTKDELKARKGAKDGLASSKGFMDLVGKTDTGSGLWFALKGGESLQGMDEVEHAFGAINVDKGLNVNVTARLKSADQASQFASQANAMAGPAMQQMGMGDVGSKLKVAADGQDLNVKLDMTTEELKQLMASPQLQMMMQMAGSGM